MSALLTSKTLCLFFLLPQQPSQWFMAPLFMRFLDHTQRRTTFGRTPLDEWSARRRDLYLTTHNTHNRQTNIRASVGFEPTIPAGERPQTHALDRAATGTDLQARLQPENANINKQAQSVVSHNSHGVSGPDLFIWYGINPQYDVNTSLVWFRYQPDEDPIESKRVAEYIIIS